MQQYLAFEDHKRLKTTFYQDMKKAFPDYDLMHNSHPFNDLSLKDVESKFTKLRNKIGKKFMRINHDLMEVEIMLERWDSKNKKWNLDRIIPGQSFNQTYLDIWYQFMQHNNGADQSILNEAGGSSLWDWNRHDNNSGGWLNMFNQSVTSTTGTQLQTVGILLGTDATAFTLLDQSLGAKVTTDWIYDAMNRLQDITVVSQAIQYQLDRIYRNITGAQVSLNEVGLSGWTKFDGDFGTHAAFMIDRTVLDNPFVVDDKESVRARYTMRVLAE